MLREHINKHCVEDEYALYMMAKTAQRGDLNVHANLISKYTPASTKLKGGYTGYTLSICSTRMDKSTQGNTAQQRKCRWEEGNILGSWRGNQQ